VSFQLLLPWPVILLVAVATAVWARQRWRTTRGRRLSVVRMVMIVVLLLFIASDPAIDGGKVAALRSDADVLFVVDTTGSSGAEDYGQGGRRIDGMQADIKRLIEEFPGAHFALITFDSSARLVVPWTTDVAAFDTAVTLVRQERTIYARGSRLELPLETMARAVPRTDDGSRYQVVFYFSDGEQTFDGAEPADFRSLRPEISSGAVLGYGTAEGGRIRVYSERDSELDLFIQDPETGEDAISRIDEDTLRGIAEDLGLSYLHRTSADGLDDLASAIADDAERERTGDREGDRRLYWVAAFGIVALVLWQLAATSVEFSDARRALGRPGRRWAR
jgi:Ca-activated chloride channel family protein